MSRSEPRSVTALKTARQTAAASQVSECHAMLSLLSGLSVVPLPQGFFYGSGVPPVAFTISAVM